MNKRRVYNKASEKECILAPLVFKQAKYQAGVAELVLEDCIQGKFIYDAFCQGQPSPAELSWH